MHGFKFKNIFSYLILIFRLFILVKRPFKILKNSLASSVQNKFHFNEGEQLSIITIRGLGATEIQNQIDQLILWFGSFVREIKNFDKELIKRE